MNSNDYRFTYMALCAVAAITIIRVLLLIETPLQFYPDEAQYWWWAQAPAFGYFSKPPVIAGLIWVTTAVFGDAEWVARLSSPLLHGATTLLVFGITKHLLDRRTAFWSALAYMTTPGVSYSCTLISTDVPLLFFWALALYAFVRAMDDNSWWWTLLCGTALGLGLESKYAMFYFILGAAVAACFSRKARLVVFGRHGLTVLVIGLTLLLPNILWNALHHFPTVAHTEGNADWGRAQFSILALVTFASGQFGVFGPFLMAGLLLALWNLVGDPKRSDGKTVLAAFCVSPLTLILIQSFISKANANWAATAYVSATPLAVAALQKLWHGRTLWMSFVLNGVAMAALWMIMISPGLSDRMGLGDAFKREQGWRQLGIRVSEEAKANNIGVIAASNRSVMAELLYYGVPRTAVMRMWDKDLHDDDHFQMTLRLRPSNKKTLLVLTPADRHTVLATFRSTSHLATIAIPIGGNQKRVTEFYAARGYAGPGALAD